MFLHLLYVSLFFILFDLLCLKSPYVVESHRILSQWEPYIPQVILDQCQ